MQFIANQTAQKLRGGYYTPPDLAGFITRWIKEIKPGRILEPSCGDGVFFAAMGEAKGFQKTNVLGFELNVDEAGKAQAAASEAGLKKVKVLPTDFLGWAIENFENKDAAFDAVVGNPPFVRYQYLPPEFQVLAERIFREFDLPFTKHTNAWVPFIVASMALLRPGGRLAMVVPSEIIHVTHAQSLRSYLGRECSRLVIIDPQELWFTDTLQGAVILLAEKRMDASDHGQGLGMYPVKGRSFLDMKPSDLFNAPQAINGKTVAGKWTRALLDLETRSLIDELCEHQEVHRFDDIAKVDVGIVTGANKFFLVPDETVRQRKLDKWAHPAFGRSEHCPGILYDERQHATNVAKGSPTSLLWFKGQLPDAAAKAYIAEGEREELHKRFKCRVRSPWYTVPSVYSTEIGMLKRAHDAPRMILNSIGAYTTDTAYRIRARDVAAERLVACFLNPLTALSAELEGRHYGGGVLELIPSEIEKLIIPLPTKAKIDLVDLDKSMRTMPTDHVLAGQGSKVLGGLGVSKAKQQMILQGWQTLRDRRHRVSGPDAIIVD